LQIYLQQKALKHQIDML